MKYSLTTITGFALLFFIGLTAACSQTGEVTSSSSNSLPPGWLATQTGAGQSGWNVVVEAATSGLVIEQSGVADYPLCLRTNVSLRDGFVESRFQPIAGVKDQAGGVVWRARDADNYYICRANGLETNVVLYKVVGGKRSALDIEGRTGGYGVSAPVRGQEWNHLRVEFSGPTNRVIFNGVHLFDVTDTTFTDAGMVGLWTKADSVVRFADFLSGEIAPHNYCRLEIPGVHNSFRVTDKVFSGSQPEGDDAFEALAKLGVKTVISVDGSKPDVATARRHGMRYIHLPFGYDGIPTNRVVELAKAVESQTGPVFVHCHHGLHRGPAAVAVICEATQNWTPQQAQAWMREAGTAADYGGLYRSAATFQKPTPAQLASVKQLPEVAKTSSLVEAMVAIDEHFSRLKLIQKAGWKTPPDHADITPDHETLMLWEQLREIARTEDSAKRSKDYQTKLTDAEKAAESLRASLKAPEAKAAIEAAFAKVGPSCAACHKQYRNQ